MRIYIIDKNNITTENALRCFVGDNTNEFM